MNTSMVTAAENTYRRRRIAGDDRGRARVRVLCYMMTDPKQVYGPNLLRTVMTTRTRSMRTATIALLTSMAAGGSAVAQVKTAAGLVQGKTTADGKVRVFLGIPYAAAPVGELRWKAPQPA